MASTKLIARRRLVALGKVYNAGAAVPEEAVRANRRVLLRTHYLEEVPESHQTVVQPVDLPEPKPPAKPTREPIAILHPDDPCKDVERIITNQTKRCGGNKAAAMDILEGNPEFREIYKRAVRISVAQAKQTRKLQSVSPNECGF
jgi:hypothetical protein